MQNITNNIIDSTSKDVLWSLQEFYNVLDFIKNHDYDINYIDEEENWATISKNGSMVGYLWYKYPLISTNDFSIENAILDKYPYVVIIHVEDFDEKVLTLDFDKVKDYLDYFDGVKGFSMSDLCFNTNIR